MAKKSGALSKLAAMFDQRKAAADEIRADVEALRQQRAELLDQRSLIESAPISGEEIRKRVAEDLSAHESRAAEFWSVTVYSAREWNPTMSLPFAHEPIGSLCLAGMRGVIEAKFVADAIAAVGNGGLSQAQREAELARINEELDSVELAEEALIRAGEEAGFEHPRRIDARPEIYLRERLD